MDPMEILYILWFLILPVMGIFVTIFGAIFWIFIVPGLAKMLTWNRFKNVSFHLVGDNSGYAELVPTKEELPEAIVLTKKGWQFLPSPIYTNPAKTEEEKQAEQIGLKKYILKGIGKPIWISYAGKITSMGMGTLAAMQQTEKQVDLKWYFDEMQKIIADTPKHFRKELDKKLKALQEATKAKPLTNIDIEGIKTAVPKMYPPSLIDALAINREMKGMRRMGRELLPWILALAVVFGMVAVSIALILVLGGG